MGQNIKIRKSEYNVTEEWLVYLTAMLDNVILNNKLQ